ncbi:hypothetical protein B566_EDAN009389 [Ephemera danica]|nr:hypothetical protein B566_EDAN009389 [Ephemera danica]
MTAPYPCPRCRDVAFCSLQCQRAALAGHHKYECRFLPAIWEAGASITCLLALRAISSDYATFYRLVSHEERRSPSDLLHRSLMAAFLLEGLSKGGYFTAPESAEDKNFIGSLLLHNLQNYGPIYTQETREARRKHLQEIYWFECFCEACDENWPLFDDIPADMESGLRLKCGECGSGIKMPTAEDNPQIAVSCPICAHKTSILASLAGLAATERQLKSAASKADAGESKVALEEYLEVLKTMEKFLAFPPIKDYILCQQAIRKCMLSFGNCRAIGKPIKVKVSS